MVIYLVIPLSVTSLHREWIIQFKPYKNKNKKYNYKLFRNIL